MDNTLWALRMALVALGAVLAKQGFGDAAMWEAVTGAVVALAGAVWSWRARQAAKAMVPPPA
jgi:hypothetical protein